jgi:hypothetical protein
MDSVGATPDDIDLVVYGGGYDEEEARQQLVEWQIDQFSSTN